MHNNMQSCTTNIWHVIKFISNNLQMQKATGQQNERTKSSVDAAFYPCCVLLVAELSAGECLESSESGSWECHLPGRTLCKHVASVLDSSVLASTSQRPTLSYANQPYHSVKYRKGCSVGELSNFLECSVGELSNFLFAVFTSGWQQ
jgi:hypothetical protein